MQRALRLAVVSCSLAYAVTGCRVSFPDDLPYSCSVDADCADSAAKCVGTPLRCCVSTGEEVCGDHLDNDCDGTVDSGGTTEVCNGLDDNCDGRIDEGFNLTTDPLNCGTCGHACGASEFCSGRVCNVRRETNCVDGQDNDDNGKTDCLDPQCEGLFCGNGCACKALVRSEARCDDGVDNDDDNGTDCADPDCAGLQCSPGPGCECVAGGAKKETSCNNGKDDDGDLLLDCADPDCVNQLCTPAPLFFNCTASGQCKCNGGAQVSESGMLCRDGVDNDCDGVLDCEEASCMGQACVTDAGMGTCSATMTCLP
ncbi:MAG: hypothetical protein IPJ65_08715 [Archangiaceae bacterium]|nr:hypothetical protein [Archangiaceae bacterium]